MDPSTAQWDDLLLSDIFVEEDIQAIYSIPLRAGFEDTPAWHFDSKGLFSVRSAYILLAHEEVMRRGGDQQTSAAATNSLNAKGDRTWLNIWRLPCPNKVKMFLWRWAHNSLIYVSI
uniref:Reverse transcriptase zinc-binding domain-containing protein n=1 Tax=Arundo donax TaxID=35708 RepID=A0A0A8XXT2_ARUDO